MALMTSLPRLLLWTCTLLCVSSVTAGKMCLECEEPEWIIDWDKTTQPSFYPSETLPITPFTDIDDIFQTIGRIWRADNILESLGYMCLRYGPEVNNVIESSILPLICDPIVDALQNGQNLDIPTAYDNFMPNFPVLDYEINLFHLLEACDVAERCENCSLLEKLDFIENCVAEDGIYLFPFVYNLAQRWAPLVFDLLQWLGPSRINLLDIFHTCSALRYVTGMETRAFSHNVINVATYLGAEYIQHLFINSSCPLIDGKYPSFDSYNLRVLQAAFNATGRNFCSEIEGAESIEEFRNIINGTIEILVERNGTFPENTGNSLILIVMDMLREMWRSYTVMDVAVTVCNIGVMSPYLNNGSISLMCRALIDGGPEELKDVCIQQGEFFNEFIYHFLDVDEPIGPFNESMIELYCDGIVDSFSRNGTFPENTGNSLILIVIDMLREMWWSYTVMDVAVTVCNIGVMNPYLNNGSIGLMCRALTDGGPEELKDVCIQQGEFFNEFIYNFLELDEPIGPFNESMIELFCDRLVDSFSRNGTFPENTGNSLILIVMDMLREMWRSYTVMDVAVTVCNISLMNPYLTNGSIGLVCRALIDGGPEEVEDVCIQQAFFNELIYDFLDINEPIGPRNVTVRPIDKLDILFLGIEWVRVLFNLQGLSLATILDVADNLFHRQNVKAMLNAAIDVILDGHFVMAFETMCLDASSFTEGVEKYLSVQSFANVIFGQDLKQMVDLFTELFPLFLGVENSDILCDNTSANVGDDGRPFQDYVEEIRMNVVNLFTSKAGCVYFMESLDEALSIAFNTPEDFLNSVLQAWTGFSDYVRLCTTVTFYLEPICYDFILKMQPALAKSERIMGVDLNFPYCYGSYWTYEKGQFTGTGRTLPELDLTISAPSPAFKYLDVLPDSRDPLDHVGVYVHTYRSNFHNEEVSVHSVIQSNGILTFEIPTQTAYVGDNTVIRIAKPDKHRRRRLRWRKDGREIVQGRGKNRLQLGNANPADAGIYEIYVSRRRSKGYHGILRLIVPACPRDYYDAPSCNKHAYVSCYNGGVLRTDTSDEQCICAYPFGGQFCHEVVLLNPREEFPLDYCLGTKCRGVMFCRRDPFGCKCASGYTGKGCKEVCPQGRYGPSCEGTCHCQGDCDPVTGQCDGMCEVGMSGWNCQYPQY